MSEMPFYERKTDQECVILFGTAGWSSYFLANMPKDHDLTYLWERANKSLPKNVKESHPANSEIKWLKVFRFEKEETK